MGAARGVENRNRVVRLHVVHGGFRDFQKGQTKENGKGTRVGCVADRARDDERFRSDDQRDPWPDRPHARSASFRRLSQVPFAVMAGSAVTIASEALRKNRALRLDGPRLLLQTTSKRQLTDALRLRDRRNGCESCRWRPGLRCRMGDFALASGVVFGLCVHPRGAGVRQPAI